MIIHCVMYCSLFIVCYVLYIYCLCFTSSSSSSGCLPRPVCWLFVPRFWGGCSRPSRVRHRKIPDYPMDIFSYKKLKVKPPGGILCEKNFFNRIGRFRLAISLPKLIFKFRGRNNTILPKSNLEFRRRVNTILLN